MNVQEQIEGIRGNDLAAIDAAGLDRKALAARGADAVLKMILVDGFFHADPHPGNVMYLPGNRIALIDFGMVGRLSPVRRNQIVDLLAGLARHDERRCWRCFSTGAAMTWWTRPGSPPISASSPSITPTCR